ncbi:MAG: hypothetical protein J0M34_00260 [Alphaproteobacteria bacterium]|nr:hypothetical protein [Alphaproteobacteria bacterium]
MEINLRGGIKLPQSLPAARGGTEIPVVKTSQNVESALPGANQANDVASAEVRRFEQVKKAAESFFKDVYAVNDHTFSIYKDASGQYITRFTSLRDGRVTYIPEPQLLQHSSGGGGSLIEIQA